MSHFKISVFEADTVVLETILADRTIVSTDEADGTEDGGRKGGMAIDKVHRVCRDSPRTWVALFYLQPVSETSLGNGE